MNISFQHKLALGILALTTCFVALWRYEMTIVQPRQKDFVNTLHRSHGQRDELKTLAQNFRELRLNVERVSAQGKVDDGVSAKINQAFTNIARADFIILDENLKSIKELEADVNTYLMITQQLVLYEEKINAFSQGFNSYFATLENDLARWKEAAAGTVAVGGIIDQFPAFSELTQRIATLQTIIPEYESFQQRLQSLQSSLNQWIENVNAFPDIPGKQQAFVERQYVLDNFPGLFATFNGYVQTMLKKERENVKQIAVQIGQSIAAIEQNFQDQYAGINNTIQTAMIQAQYRDGKYRVIKWSVVGFLFVSLIGLFMTMVVYAFRFQSGLALFKQQTDQAAVNSRILTESLKDHTELFQKNYEFSKTLKEGLQETSQGFAGRQLKLQYVDRLMNETDELLKDSQLNVHNIKEEFYNAERVSQEIVHVTQALEGVAQQMNSIADSARASVEQSEEKQKTVDELKYLTARIRHAVSSTHTALDTRREKISQTKTQFEAVENNMAQMIENTKNAVRAIALARLDHSQEESRINEILQNAKNSGRVIAEEIETLNKQISDFSVLSKHLDALHELAMRASSLNSRSFLVHDQNPEQTSSSQRMNQYIEEYFKRTLDVRADAVKSEFNNGQVSLNSDQQKLANIPPNPGESKEEPITLRSHS